MTENETMMTPQETRREILKAMKRRDDAAAERERAKNELEAEEAKLAKQQEKLAAARQKIIDQDNAKAKADIDLRRAEASEMPEKVTRADAIKVAKRLLKAFDTYRENPDQLNPQQLRDFGWEAIDDARDRLLTTEVDNDAQLVTMAVEGVTGACERWELMCSGRLNSSFNEHTESLGEHPITNRRVEVHETELRSILNSGQPKPMESMGDLISQGIDCTQIARMLGLVLANGSADLANLGAIIDSGDTAQPSYLFVRFHGTLVFEKAWKRRQEWIPRRRGFRADHYMTSAHGAARPGRRSGMGVASRAANEERDALIQRDQVASYIQEHQTAGNVS